MRQGVYLFGSLLFHNEWKSTWFIVGNQLIFVELMNKWTYQAYYRDNFCFKWESKLMTSRVPCYDFIKKDHLE